MILRGGRRSKQQTVQSVRPRQVRPTVDASFRRNAAFVSKSQREKTDQQRTATERQLLQKKHRTQRRLKMRLMAAAFCMLMVGVLAVFRVHSVEIRSNASSKLGGEKTTLYQEKIKSSALKHTTFGQSWLLDTAALTQSVYDEFPEIAHISLTKNPPLYQNLVATIRFRTPVFTWVDAQHIRQYVDAEGVLFTKNLDSGVQDDALVTIEDQSGVVLAAGDTVLTKEIVAFIGKLHTVLPPLFGDAKIEKVIIPTATREVQVKMSNTPYIIKFSSVRPLEEQTGELQLLLQHLQGSGVVPAAVIDMRVPHKAFYK